jgi:hypothetical protein
MRKLIQRYNLLVFFAVPALAVLALLNLGLIADASCQIWWLTTEQTCTVAQSDPLGHFDYNQYTQWGSAGKGAWTLTQAISWPPESNINHVGCNPSSSSVGDNGGISSDEILTRCQGDLVNPALNGTSKLNAWDGTGSGGLPECSGSHNVTVKAVGGSCP